MSLLNTLTFGLIGNNDDEIKTLNKKIKKCKKEKKKTQEKLNNSECKLKNSECKLKKCEYELKKCKCKLKNNFLVPICDSFCAKDDSGNFDLFTVVDGIFTRACFDPRPCPYNGSKKNYWNVGYDEDGIKCLVAGTNDIASHDTCNDIIRNPPHSGDCVSIKFKIVGQKCLKFSFRYKIKASPDGANGYFIFLVNGCKKFSTSDTGCENNGWIKYCDTLQCYDILEFKFCREDGCYNDVDEVVCLKDICLCGGYIKACPKNCDVVCPKKYDAECPKNDDVECPKNDDVECPKNDDVECPKNDDVECSKNDDECPPKKKKKKCKDGICPY